MYYIHFTQTLTTIDLTDNTIGVDGAIQLANALLVNTVRPKFTRLNLLYRILISQTLKTLNLGTNQIGVAGVQYLARALQRNTVRLDFS